MLLNMKVHSFLNIFKTIQPPRKGMTNATKKEDESENGKVRRRFFAGYLYFFCHFATSQASMQDRQR